LANETTIITALRTLFQPGDVFEIRILDAVLPNSNWQHTESGYFDYEHIDNVPNAIANFKTYAGVYVTINPVNPDLLARANNRFKKAKSRETTSDKDILRRRWMLIDVDPVRPAGISATELEHNLSLDKAAEIVSGLESMGFPRPMRVNSGNGTQLLYRIDLPADDGGMVQQCLQQLSSCSTDDVHVDTSVHNAARICRLPGTWNRKGDSIDTRPHRMAEIIDKPDKMATVSVDLLRRLSNRSKQVAPSPQTPPKQVEGVAHSPQALTQSSNFVSTIDDFNQRGNIAPILEKHGWTLKSESDQQSWWRPGKTTGQHSANYDGTVFYVWSDNAEPFNARQGYNRFGVYSMLEHSGDNSVAIVALKAQSYGADDSDVDLSGILGKVPSQQISVIEPEDDTPDIPEDPGVMPVDMMRIPGFISDVMDYCNENSPVRNPAMAFCGALALQSVLGARKVRDPADNRTNLYLIALAPTGGGKDFPRKINQAVLRQMGMDSSYVTRFGSGEAIEDKLAATPTLLCQTDEIDGMLLQIKGARDARFESLIERLKEIFTSADSAIVTRCLAGKNNTTVDQPSLTIFGTAVPVHYYAALSEKMLTDGFFSRTICVEASCEVEDQDPTIVRLPDRIKEQIAWWAHYSPTPGDLANLHPEPTIIELTEEAKRIITAVRQEARRHQNDANAVNDTVKAAIWSRVRQMTRKLALIYAISRDCRNSIIDAEAMSWSRDFVTHQAKRMLFMAHEYVSDNPFHAQCLKVVKRLRESPEQTLGRKPLLRFMHCKASELNDIVGTLIEQGRVSTVEIPSKTRAAVGYKLIY